MEAESASDSNQPGPSNKRIRDKDDNSGEDGALIDFIHMSTSQTRGHENAFIDENQDNHKKKNDGCSKCHKTMQGKACLKCQDGCLKWWHTEKMTTKTIKMSLDPRSAPRAISADFLFLRFISLFRHFFGILYWWVLTLCRDNEFFFISFAFV
ncbi:unnamed protein product, partial [Mesorhabditis belari]|uniref:Uncharacterized protein n=1 Tax=Mesorhabditis belari TaxID=2138241 RepID=A0AAF3J388_9BILA